MAEKAAMLSAADRQMAEELDDYWSEGDSDDGPPESESLLDKARDVLAARAAALARARFCAPWWIEDWRSY